MRGFQIFENIRAIRPEDFEVFSKVPGIAAVARDQDLRLFWCTHSFYRLSGTVEHAEDMIGTTLEDVLTPMAAKERGEVHKQVMETGEIKSHYQFSVDSRIICTIFPLDEQAFGHRGIFAVIKDAPVHERLGLDKEIPVLSTPNLYELNALTSRELEVLHYVARGQTTQEIASVLSRAPKTIEHHINSIHSKLQTQSRAHLVRWSSERGLQSFSDSEWEKLVEGARLVRKEQTKNH